MVAFYLILCSVVIRNVFTTVTVTVTFLEDKFLKYQGRRGGPPPLPRSDLASRRRRRCSRARARPSIRAARRASRRPPNPTAATRPAHKRRPAPPRPSGITASASRPLFALPTSFPKGQSASSAARGLPRWPGITSNFTSRCREGIRFCHGQLLADNGGRGKITSKDPDAAGYSRKILDAFSSHSRMPRGRMDPFAKSFVLGEISRFLGQIAAFLAGELSKMAGRESAINRANLASVRPSV